jgi:DNA-binding beta-propeller fold protein YncE
MNNYRIQKFDSNGTFLTKWGSRGVDDGQFMKPSGIDLDSSENVYIVDKDTSLVQKFDGNGTFLTKWGGLGTGDNQFLELEDIEIDSSDDVYVADRGTSTIKKFTKIS